MLLSLWLGIKDGGCRILGVRVLGFGVSGLGFYVLGFGIILVFFFFNNLMGFELDIINILTWILILTWSKLLDKANELKCRLWI